MSGQGQLCQKSRDGWSKMSLVKGLASSGEGKAHGMTLAGLRKA